MKKFDWDELIKKIDSAESIAICSHISPDGDNIGSILAMALGLRSLGYNVDMWKLDDIPKNLKFLGGDSVMTEPKLPVDLLLVLDCSDEGRLGEHAQILSEAVTVVNIDHHKSNNNFGDMNFVAPGLGATGELVFDLLETMGVKWTDGISVPLYTAISSDTGSFKYDSATHETLERASILLKHIENPGIINENLYQSKSMAEVKLLGRVIDTMKIIPEISTISARVSLQDMKEFNAESDDTESIVSFLNGINEARMTVFLKEKEEGIVKVSFRSKGDYNVADIAEIFGGGGHKNAAGLTFKGSIDKAEKAIISKIKEIYE